MNHWMGLLAVTALGCDSIEVSTIGQEVDTCPPDGCLNSSETEIREIGMHEFNLRGLPNLNGAAIIPKLVKDGEEWDLGVANGRIFGTHPQFGPLTGPALAGAEIVFKGQTSPPFAVHIYRARMSSFAVGSPDMFEAYQLGWHDLDKPRAPTYELASKVCVDRIQVSGTEDPQYTYLGVERGESVVFEGERIDSAAKTIGDRWDPDWFTVGCAGTALAKLFLLRQTTVSSNGQSMLDQRRAHLKMLVADYCGDGTSFTMPGEGLLWRSPLLDYPDPAGDQTTAYELEARWTAQGAACLWIPRLAESKLPHPYDKIMTAIHEQCPALPECSNTNAWDFDGATLVTANPPPGPP